MPDQMMTDEMVPEKEDKEIYIAKYKEGLQRILQSTNIAEIRSIAQELLEYDMKMEKTQPGVEIKQGEPSLRNRLDESYGREV